MTAPIQGVLPPRDDRLVVMASCDTPYVIEHWQALAYSVSDNAPSCRLHLHVLSPEPGLLDALTVLAWDLAVPLTVTWENLDIRGGDEQARKAVLASMRFLRAPIVDADRMLILDADCVVRREPDDAIEPWAGVGLYLRPAHPLEMKVAAGAVYAAGQDGRAFLAAAAQNIGAAMKAGQVRWYMDQIALAQVDGVDSHAALQVFDQGFMSWEWGEDAVIWTGKGPRKSDDAIYVDAANRYRRFEVAGVQDRLWGAPA